MKRVAHALVALLLVLGGGAIGSIVKGARVGDDHGGAFTGPCTFEPHSPIGPADSLTLTDYGPPVSVGHIIVANLSPRGRALRSTRVTVGGGSNLIVGHRESRTFLVKAPRSTESCKLVDWGERPNSARD